MSLNEMLSDWTRATADLKYGVQRVFHDVFALASEGKTTLIYGADYREGHPCLVNTVGAMLTTGGGSGIPTANFGQVVSLFDRLNTEFASKGINDKPGYVSPLAAEILLRNFAPLKSQPVGEAVDEATKMERFAMNLPYREPSDEDFARDMIEAFMKPAAEAAEEGVDALEATFQDETISVRYPHN